MLHTLQQMRQMAQDIELARNNAHMLIEAVSFADPDLEAIEENELIQVYWGLLISNPWEWRVIWQYWLMDSNLHMWSWMLENRNSTRSAKHCSEASSSTFRK